MRKIIALLNIFKDLRYIFLPKSARVIPNLVRFVKGVELSKYGIVLKYNSVVKGLWKKPFTIEFGEMLREISNGEVDVEAINSYVSGNYDKLVESNISFKRVSNLLDPTSRLADVWFGTYIVFDDKGGKGRAFMLKDSSGDPSDLDNINSQSMTALTKYDQKIITWSSHENQKGYTRQIFEDEFFFKLKGDLSESIIPGPNGERWKKVEGAFETWSMLTDIDKTDMKLFSSVRGYCGLPNYEVYELVDPWHNIVFHGSVIAKYFCSDDVSFWAISYYGGTEFSLKDGTHINNWADTNLHDLCEGIFQNMSIGTVKPWRHIDSYAAKKRLQKWLNVDNLD